MRRFDRRRWWDRRHRGIWSAGRSGLLPARCTSCCPLARGPTAGQAGGRSGTSSAMPGRPVPRASGQRQTGTELQRIGSGGGAPLCNAFGVAPAAGRRPGPRLLVPSRDQWRDQEGTGVAERQRGRKRVVTPPLCPNGLVRRGHWPPSPGSPSPASRGRGPARSRPQIPQTLGASSPHFRGRHPMPLASLSRQRERRMPVLLLPRAGEGGRAPARSEEGGARGTLHPLPTRRTIVVYLSVGLRFSPGSRSLHKPALSHSAWNGEGDHWRVDAGLNCFICFSIRLKLDNLVAVRVADNLIPDQVPFHLPLHPSPLFLGHTGSLLVAQD